MELYKRADGRSPFWHYDVVDPITGKRVRKSTKTTDKKLALKRALEATEGGQDETLADASEAYVARMKADGLRSWGAAQRQINKFLGKVGPLKNGKARFAFRADKTVSSVAKSDVEKLRVERSKEGNEPGTIAAELRILRAVCRYSRERGNKPSAVLKWGVPKPNEKLCYLSADEAQRVLRRLHPDTPVKAGSKGKLVVPEGRTYQARQDTHDLFLALVLTGGRWAEVAKLLRSKVNLTENTVTLFGWKGQKERTVPLVPELREMFARRLARPGPSLIFPGKRKKDGSSARSAPTRAIQRAMTAEGCNAPELVAERGRATNHSLRHTYASWLRQKGLALDEVQPLLGHSNIKTTMVYAKVVPAETLDRAKAALAGIGLATKAPDPVGTPDDAPGTLPAHRE